MAVSQARAQPAYAGGLGETWVRQQQQQQQEEVGGGDSSEGSSVALNLATSADLSPSSPNCSYDTDGLPSSPPLASSSPQPPQPPLSPTSSTLRTVQSTLATVQNLQACLSQMTAPQPLWPPPMQNLSTMPTAMPPLPRLSTSGEVESLRMLLQQQQQAVQQAQQAQAMFLFNPGSKTKNMTKAEIYVCFPPRTSCRPKHSIAAASSGAAACCTGNSPTASTATSSRERGAAGRHNKQPTSVAACQAGVASTFLPLPAPLPSSYSLHPTFPLPAHINPPLLSLPPPSPTPISPPWPPCPSPALPSSSLPSRPSLPFNALS